MNTRFEGQTQPPDDERPISPSDLLTLPPAQRRIVRILLRSNGMNLAELSQALDLFPPEERLAPAALAETIAQLEQARWLVSVEGLDPPVYQAARLGWTGPAHPEDRLSERHRSGASRLSGFWDSVKEDEEKRLPTQSTTRRPASGGISSLFSELAHPNASLSDVHAEHKAPPTKPGGGRISSLFEELSQPAQPPAHDHESPDEDGEA